MTQKLKPFYEDVQAHYDLSDDFFKLFLDPSRTYSCAYFREDDMTLEQAQIAKVDLSLSKCNLQPGQKILDIGCDWGTTAIRDAEEHSVDAIGITLSKTNMHSLRVARSTAHRKSNSAFKAGKNSANPWIESSALEHSSTFAKNAIQSFFKSVVNCYPTMDRCYFTPLCSTRYQRSKNWALKLVRKMLLSQSSLSKRSFPAGSFAILKESRNWQPKMA